MDNSFRSYSFGIAIFILMCYDIEKETYFKSFKHKIKDMLLWEK